MTADNTERPHIVDRKWQWLLVLLFVAGEWFILFAPDLRSSFAFLRQGVESLACPDIPKDALLQFFNFRMWLIVSLSQAIIWGAVACVSLRWLGDLWMTGEPGGRWRRVVTVVFRSLLFGFGLWFFLTPAPKWHLGCFSGHISVRASGVLAYVAVGFAAIVMWVLENRVCSLPLEKPTLATTRRYVELRHRLQILLLMSSVILAFGVIGLIARRTFLQEISPDSFFPNSIVLEGFEYTLLLALAYAPVHAAFNTVGAKLRDGLMPVPESDGVDAIQQWAKFSNELGDLMQIQIYDWKSFGPGIPILAPFLLGLISDLLKKLV